MKNNFLEGRMGIDYPSIDHVFWQLNSMYITFKTTRAIVIISNFPVLQLHEYTYKFVVDNGVAYIFHNVLGRENNT